MDDEAYGHRGAGNFALRKGDKRRLRSVEGPSRMHAQLAQLLVRRTLNARA